MNDNFLAFCVIAISAIPAIIAAVSSLRNGKRLRENGTNPAGGATSKPRKTKKNGQNPDWFHPPDL